MSNTRRYYNIQKFNFLTSELEQLELRTVGYYRDHRTGNYVLTYCNPDIHKTSRYHRQQLVALPAFFARVVPEIKADVIAGSIEITPAQFNELGFVTHTVKGGVDREISA